MQSNYNNMISKEKRMKVFRMLVIACVIFWIVIFMWQKTHESDITDAKATSFTISLERIAGISSTQMSYLQKKFLQLDDAAEVIKKVLIPCIIIFAILSIYYHMSVKNLKNNKNAR